MVEALGLSTKEIIFALVNFLILIGVLGKFLYKPFLGALDNRRNTIIKSLDDAAEKNRRAEALMEEYRVQLAGAEEEGREIVRIAKVRAEEQAQRIVDEATEKALRIREDAERAIELEHRKALEEVRNEIVDLAMLAAEKVMEHELQAEGQREIVDNIIRQAGVSGWQN